MNLDGCWTYVWSDNGVKECLEAGQWNFAIKSSQIDYDPAIDPDFGYTRAFTKPDDWVLISAVCSDEFFRSPLTRYVDEAGYWYSDLDTIYVRYVSNSVNYAMNMGLWPESFTKYVQAHFASRIVLRTSSSEADHQREPFHQALKSYGGNSFLLEMDNNNNPVHMLK